MKKCTPTPKFCLIMALLLFGWCEYSFALIGIDEKLIEGNTATSEWVQITETSIWSNSSLCFVVLGVALAVCWVFVFFTINILMQAKLKTANPEEYYKIKQRYKVRRRCMNWFLLVVAIALYVFLINILDADSDPMVSAIFTVF